MKKTASSNTSLVSILLAFLLAAPVFCRAADETYVHEADYSKPIRVACIGDSITYGFGIKDREHDSYPAQLASLLGPKWEVRNFGVNSATALKDGNRPYNLQPAFRDALDFKPDVVILLLGTNDTNEKNWPAHKEKFISDYSDLVAAFSKLETKPRIYLGLPVPIFRDQGKVYDTDKVLVEEIIPKIKQIAEKAGFPVFDLHGAFAGKGGLFRDGVHPDATGARLMAEVIYAKLTGKKAADPK